MRASLFPARLVGLLEEGVNVGDGEEHVALCEQAHAGDDVTLPKNDKWLQRVLQMMQGELSCNLLQINEASLRP